MQIFETSNVFNIVEELVNKLDLKMGDFLLEKEVACMFRFSSWAGNVVLVRNKYCRPTIILMGLVELSLTKGL